MRDNLSSSKELEDLFGFTLGLLECSVGVMFLIDGSEPVEICRAGLPDDVDEEYFSGAYLNDPLYPPRLIQKRSDVTFLSIEQRSQKTSDQLSHARFHQRIGVLDEVDLLLWINNRPAALLCLMKSAFDPKFSISEFQWHAMHRHLGAHICRIPSIRQACRTYAFKDSFGLTCREIEVVGLIEKGASNAVISNRLGMAISTVKSHVINIMDKLGVNSRLAISAFDIAINPGLKSDGGALPTRSNLRPGSSHGVNGYWPGVPRERPPVVERMDFR